MVIRRFQRVGLGSKCLFLCREVKYSGGRTLHLQLVHAYPSALFYRSGGGGKVACVVRGKTNKMSEIVVDSAGLKSAVWMCF